MEPTYTPGPGPLFGLPDRGNAAPGAEPNPQPTEPPSKQLMSTEPVGLGGEISPKKPEVVSTTASEPQNEPPRWMARSLLVVEVMVWVELGMILMVVPWTRSWTDNSFILNYPKVRELLGMHFVRGAVTGIGLLDIWTGMWRAIHYSDPAGQKK